MNVEISGFARKSQKLSQTAGAVFVITSEDIRRSGATILPEVLRLAPGVHVARIDTGRWAISSRGFNNRFANKMLVLIDGRSIYNGINGGVYWEHHDLPLDDIERIEVIRGPGATSWGANAVNGVINIITRKAADTQGAHASVVAGGEERGGAYDARWGGAWGDKFHYRVSGKVTRLQATRPDLAGSALDPWNQQRVMFRADWQPGERDEVSVHAGGSGLSAKETVSRAFQFAPSKDWISADASGQSHFGLARWRRVGARIETNVQFYTSYERRDDAFGLAAMRQQDVDVQQRARFQRHDLVWGAGYRASTDDSPLSKRASLYPQREMSHLGATFIQDELAIIPDKLTLTFGSKFLFNSFAGSNAQPGVRIAWAPRRDWSVWGSATRAVRLPSRYERAVETVVDIPEYGVRGVFRGDSELRAEFARSWEAGFRKQWTRRFSTDIAGFANRYSGLVGTLYDRFGLHGGVPAIYAKTANGRRAVAHGVETTAQADFGRVFKASVNHSLFTGHHPFWSDRMTPFSIGNVTSSPRHMVQVHLSGEAGRRHGWDVFVFHTGTRPEFNLPPRTRMDARWGFRVKPEFEISAGVRNAGRGRPVEFLTEDLVSNRTRTTAYVKLDWTFGGR